jgi:hypothetical protein
MERNMKKIAFCFSGQPRTWKKCKDSWEYLIQRVKEKTNAEIDFFCHMWNFNTPPHNIFVKLDPKHSSVTLIPESEISEILLTLKPTKYVIEDENASKSKYLKNHNLTLKYNKRSKFTLLYWSASQFHSLMYSAFLKQQYELEHNFFYDMCFRMRYDLYFNKEQVDIFMSDFPDKLSQNTVYSCHTGNTDQWPFIRLGDIFFYADSPTFDQVCDFVNWLPDIGTTPFPNADEVLPEVAFFYYIKMFKLNNVAIDVDPKIIRSEETLW